MQGGHPNQGFLGGLKGIERPQRHGVVRGVQQGGGVLKAHPDEAGHLLFQKRRGGRLLFRKPHEKGLAVLERPAPGIAHHFQGDRRRAADAHVESVGRGVGQIEDALFTVGAAVVDAHHHILAVAGIGNLEHRAERQLAVGRRHGVHVEGFAAGRAFAVVPFSEPRGRAADGLGGLGAFGGCDARRHKNRKADAENKRRHALKQDEFHGISRLEVQNAPFRIGRERCRTPRACRARAAPRSAGLSSVRGKGIRSLVRLWHECCQIRKKCQASIKNPKLPIMPKYCRDFSGLDRPPGAAGRIEERRGCLALCRKMRDHGRRRIPRRASGVNPPDLPAPRSVPGCARRVHLSAPAQPCAFLHCTSTGGITSS